MRRFSFAGKTALCRGRLCRVRKFVSRHIPLKTFHRNVSKMPSIQAAHKGGAVLFAPPPKSCRFSHPPSPCAQKYGHGDFAVCGRRLRGHVPSKNTSPTALSWISLFGHTDAVRFCSCTMGFVFCYGLLLLRIFLIISSTSCFRCSSCFIAVSILLMEYTMVE